MKMKCVLFGLFLSLVATELSAQGWAVELFFEVTNGTTACGGPVNSTNMSLVYSFNGGSFRNLNYSNYTNSKTKWIAVVKETAAWLSTGNTLRIQGIDNCNGNTIIDYTFTMGFNDTQCNGTHPGPVSNLYVLALTFFPRMNTSVNRICDAVTLSSPCTYAMGGTTSTDKTAWEISTSPTGPFKSLTGKTQNTISLSASELVALGFSNPYNTIFYVRVSDAALSGRTSAVTSFHLYAPSPAVSITGSSDVVCKGESNGTVTFEISNAVPEVNRFYINYTHTDGTANVDTLVYTGTHQITGLKAGDWTFVVTNNYDKDNYGLCNTSVSATVKEPTQVTVDFNTPLYNGYAIKCKGGATGETTAIGSGGVGGYKDFSWNTGATTDKITGLAAGTYTVTLKDANNCIAFGQVVLQEPTALQASAATTTNYNGYPVSCWDKTDGAVKGTATGGLSGYTYLWSSGGSTNIASGLGVGTYTLTVTDANRCTAQTSIALTAPPPIDFAINELASLTCPGDQTAILEARPVASTIIGSAHYSWLSGETVSTIQDKGAGTYSVTVSDDQGCSTTKSRTLTDPPPNTVSISPLSNYNGSYIKCNGESNGSLAAIVKDENNNTITAQDYLWTAGTRALGEGATLSTLNNLGKGQYKVVITYRNQCKAEASYFLSEPDPVTVAVSIASNYNGQAISCYNMTDGKLHAVATGGTGALSYLWNTGATGSLLSNVGAGSYTATVKDVNGCTATQTMELQNPEPVQASITSVSDYSGYGISCYGLSDGSITAEGTGGTGVYTYTWSNGKTSAVINSLPTGNYTVT
ncbi:MAG TPA: SprB repeat-containing protein, partial [Ohtaekwangia sp.]|uniref:SprB repeat-containing protein n=1 Tax=Ohtaekwangia sp. TaxID=2066019 RepID=UPI002F9265AD